MLTEVFREQDAYMAIVRQITNSVLEKIVQWQSP